MSIPVKGGNGQKTTPAVFNTIGVLFLRSPGNEVHYV